MVECDLAKVEVAGSNPVSRSRSYAPQRLLGRFSCSRIRISFNESARGFGFTCVIDFYEALAAAAKEDGEGVVFTSMCPQCEPLNLGVQLRKMSHTFGP